MSKTTTILALLALASFARANLVTVNEISGDANSLHADLSLQWDGFPQPGGIHPDASGTWEGGSWEFIGSITPPFGDYGEAETHLYLRNAWADGWNPGPAYLFFHTQPFLDPPHLTDQPLHEEYGLSAKPIAYDYGHTGSVYHLDVDVSGFYNPHDFGGSAHFVFDLQRSAGIVTQNVLGRVVDVQSVPDNGSSILLAITASIALSVSRSFMARMA